jgi:hypothetical protein
MSFLINEGLNSWYYAGCDIPDSEVTQIHHRAFGEKAGKPELDNGVLSTLIIDFWRSNCKIAFLEIVGVLAQLLHQNEVVQAYMYKHAAKRKAERIALGLQH